MRDLLIQHTYYAHLGNSFLTGLCVCGENRAEELRALMTAVHMFNNNFYVFNGAL